MVCIYQDHGSGSQPEGTEGVDYKTILSSMVNDQRIATIPSDADFVAFFGGTNGMDEESYRSTLNKIKVQAPNAEIICINLPYRKDEETISDFSNRRNIITQVAQDYNYPVVQLNQLMEVNAENADSYMTDNVHWNVSGNNLIAKYVLELIEQNFI